MCPYSCHVAENNPVTVNRTQRIVAYMLVGSLVLSILAMIASLIARAVGVTDLGVGVWPAVVLLPGIGLPLSFALLLVLIIMNASARSRAARDAPK